MAECHLHSHYSSHYPRAPNTTYWSATTGLYRGLELLRTKPWGYGVPLGGKVNGKININTIQDQSLLMAILDPQNSNGFTQANVTTLWQNLILSRTPNMQLRTLADGTTVQVPISGQTVDDHTPPNPTPGKTNAYTPYPTYPSTPTNPPPAGTLLDQPFKPFGTANYQHSPIGSTTPPWSAANGSGIQETILRPGTTQSWWNNGNQAPPLIFIPPGTTSTSPNHLYFQAEAARKMLNSITTVSNTFEIYLTVGFFEVRTDPSGNILYEQFPNSGIRRPLIGKEAYISVPGDIRQQYFAIVDRNNATVNATPTSNPPLFTDLAASAAAGTGQGRPATSSSLRKPPLTVTAITDPATGMPIVKEYSSFWIGIGPEQEQVSGTFSLTDPSSPTRGAAPPAGTVFVILSNPLSKTHAAGTAISTAQIGNPGPPSPSSPFNYTAGTYGGLLPYITRIK